LLELSHPSGWIRNTHPFGHRVADSHDVGLGIFPWVSEALGVGDKPIGSMIQGGLNLDPLVGFESKPRFQVERKLAVPSRKEWCEKGGMPLCQMSAQRGAETKENLWGDPIRIDPAEKFNQD
jgi:hypothetical protein